jgi:hypothetical protein
MIPSNRIVYCPMLPEGYDIETFFRFAEDGSPNHAVSMGEGTPLLDVMHAPHARL